MQLTFTFHEGLAENAVRPNLLAVIEAAEQGAEVIVEAKDDKRCSELFVIAEKLMRDKEIPYTPSPHLMFRVGHSQYPGAVMLGSIRFKREYDPAMDRLVGASFKQKQESD
jgi:hypothetical protein